MINIFIFKQEKKKVKEEIKQFKNMKRREIMDKIDKLREIIGDLVLEFQEEDLEIDFDLQKYDEMMKVFKVYFIMLIIELQIVQLENYMRFFIISLLI